MTDLQREELVERLAEALKPFAEAAPRLHGDPRSPVCPGFTIADFRRAAEALSALQVGGNEEVSVSQSQPCGDGGIAAPTEAGGSGAYSAIRYLRSKLATVAFLASDFRDAHEAAREGLAITEEAWAWLDHSTALPTTDEPRLLRPEEVEWVTNDNGELGVKIGNQFFFLYKGRSLVYGAHSDDSKDGIALHDEGEPMHWRPVFKREFGECAHPINYGDPRMIGTASLGDSDDWKSLPAATAGPARSPQPIREDQSKDATTPPQQPQEATDREEAEMIERVAEEVYAAMVWTALNAPGKPEPWVARGNSHAQFNARHAARSILAMLSAVSTPSIGGRSENTSSVAGSSRGYMAPTDKQHPSGKED